MANATNGEHVAGNDGKKARITLDLPLELHLRLKLFSALTHESMREVIEASLEQKLPPLEDLSAANLPTLEHMVPASQANAARLRATRERIMRGRRFETNSATLLREARAENEVG